MSTPPLLLVMLHGSPTGAKESGTVIRFRQFDAAHHSCPLTAWLATGVPPATEPGAFRPDASQAAAACATVSVGGRSSTGRPRAAGSQLRPTMGTATRAQAIVSEQPSDALSSEVNTLNLALPVPSGAV